MNIQPLHPNFSLPTRGTNMAGAFDVYMPEGGVISDWDTEGVMVPLGFAAEIPEGYVALLLPRSGVGAKYGLELHNTCGVIDADYRGEWKACLSCKQPGKFEWFKGDRLVQFLIVPVLTPELNIVRDLSATARGTGGFGSTNQ